MPSPSPDTDFCAGFISAQIENTILSANMDRRLAVDYMSQCLICLRSDITRSLLSPEAWLTREGKATLRDVLKRGEVEKLLDSQAGIT